MQSTALSVQCYAIRKEQGFDYLAKNGITELDKGSMCDLVENNKFGEKSAGKSFLRDASADTRITKNNSYKQRAVIFKRSLIKRTTRKKFDEGIFQAISYVHGSC